MTFLSIEQPPYVTLGTKNEYFSSVFDLCQLVHVGPGHVTGWGFGSRGYARCRAGQGPGGTFLRSTRPNGHSVGGWWVPVGRVLMQRNCMSISLNRGEMCISSLVWLCLGGPGRPDRSWRRIAGDGGPWG